MNSEERYQDWLEKEDLDKELRESMRQLNDKQIDEQFGSELEFGTGGLRAKIGVGPNRLNIYTVRKNTEGVGQYIASFGQKAKDQGVVIAYDNRHKSQDFAKTTAAVLAKHGIQVYLFESLRTTPELSFAIRYLHAFAGVVLTASHNPKEYNGYKVYNHKGCQCVPRETDVIIQYIKGVKDEFQVDIADEQTYQNYVHYIGQDVDQAYYQEVMKIEYRHNTSIKDYKIIYSPQHGTGNIPVRYVLEKKGYNIDVVESQCTPDPDFSCTQSPNPEDPRSFIVGLQEAKEKNADMVMTTDPDCDRLGIAVKHHGEYVRLTGNQTGSILIQYILEALKENNQLPKNGIVFNTVVTSALGQKIAEDYHVKVESTLTGFKFIGDRIGHYEETKEYQFLFGYEESYGYLIKDFTRDKDGVQSCFLIGEVANYYAHLGLTLVDVLENIYKKYGYYLDAASSIKMEGQDGQERMKEILSTLRQTQVQELGGQKVLAQEDYLTSLRTDQKGKTKINLPQSNVLKYFLEDGSWVAIRPSGTEPKCKFYYSICDIDDTHAKEKLKKIKETLNTILDLSL